jgi:hypothetical protein
MRNTASAIVGKCWKIIGESVQPWEEFSEDTLARFIRQMDGWKWVEQSSTVYRV